jgi:hypothetical protein
VEEVESFDETTIVMSTSKGSLVVRGEDLHIEKLSLDGGDFEGGRARWTPSPMRDDAGDRGGFFRPAVP